MKPNRTHEILEESIRLKTYYYIDLINKLYTQEYKYPEIIFNLNGKVAGKAYLEAWSIHYNITFASSYYERFLNDTVPHEVAHLAAWAMYEHSGHKKVWKTIMMNLGITDPKRCHNYI